MYTASHTQKVQVRGILFSLALSLEGVSRGDDGCGMEMMGEM